MQKHATRKWLKTCLIFLLVTGSLYICGCGLNNNAPTFNIAGNWDVYSATTGNVEESGPNLFTFTTSDSTISGMTMQGQVITGTISGLDILFSWVGSDGATNTYTGTVSSDGMTMSGIWSDTKTESGTWNAIIISSPSNSYPPAVSVARFWNISQITSGAPGAQTNAFAFTQSGNSIAGTTQGHLFTGIISSQSIVFFWNNGTTNFAFTGTVSLDGTAMSGTWSGNNGQSGTWSAT